jgi:hypothetical protein
VPADSTARAFEIDWARLDQARFRRLIARADDDGSSSVLLKTKSVLCDYRDLVYSTFTWYAASNPAMDGYELSSLAFFSFVTDCKIVDKESPHCKMADLDTLFILQNVEDSSAPSEENEINPSRTLLFCSSRSSCASRSRSLCAPAFSRIFPSRQKSSF